MKKRGKAKPHVAAPAVGVVSAQDVNALVSQGLSAHRAGELGAARLAYKQALDADPNHPDALNLSGVLAFSEGRIQEAIGLIKRAIRVYPSHLDAYLNLAEAQAAAGARREALATCQSALALAPDFSEAHARLAWLYAHDPAPLLKLALAHARVALALDPQSVEALCARGLAHTLARQYAEGQTAYRAALGLAPDDLRVLTGLASNLGLSELVDEARALYQRALALKPEDPMILAPLAGLAEIEGDIESALDLYTRALARQPGAPDWLCGRAGCYRDLGRFEDAEAQYGEALKSDTRHAPAYLALARMKRLEDSLPRRRLLAQLAADRARPPRHRVQAGFALGELLEQASDFDGAFARYAEANALYKHVRTENGEVFDRPELIEQSGFIKDFMAREYANDTGAWGHPTELPVFVVGMPRSGTTLIEQICASHPHVKALGETRDIVLLAQRLASHNEGRQHISDWDGEMARREAVALYEDMNRRAQGATRVVEKSPFNILRLGTVAASFPRSRIIWCRRDWRDVVVSNHTMYFTSGNVFSTDLADCAFVTEKVEELGRVWQETLNVRILEVVYEELVADMEPQIRRIIDFLDLPWDPACLRFYETDRHVDTPSSWQVRQPLYQRSVGRWRRFAQPLERTFGDTLSA